jgi:shikimate kinase
VNVYLVGMPGSGKSSVGLELARLLNLPFVDLDRTIELDEGSPIPEIFERGGETAFRRAEARALREAGSAAGAVIACGGGTVLDPANRAVLASTGTVVYLEASLETLARRVGTGAGRPLISDDGDLGRLLDERAPVYREVANHVVSSEGPASEVAAAIREAIPEAIR